MKRWKYFLVLRSFSFTLWTSRSLEITRDLVFPWGKKHPFASVSLSPHHMNKTNKSASLSTLYRAYFLLFLAAKHQVSSPVWAVSCYLLDVPGKRRGLSPKQCLHPQFCCALLPALSVVFLSCQALDSSPWRPDYFSNPKNSLTYVNKQKVNIFESHTFPHSKEMSFICNRYNR